MTITCENVERSRHCNKCQKGKRGGGRQCAAKRGTLQRIRPDSSKGPARVWTTRNLDRTDRANQTVKKGERRACKESRKGLGGQFHSIGTGGASITKSCGKILLFKEEDANRKRDAKAEGEGSVESHCRWKRTRKPYKDPE